MKRLLPVLLILSACNSGSESPTSDVKQTPTAEASADSGLTGLYESAAGEQTSQLCMIGKNAKEAAFGLVVWGSNMHSCSGTGTATLDGGMLRLAMAGDSECAIDASMANGTIALPATIPQGCAYYCGAQATLTGTSFTKKAATHAAALEAKDLVGDSLCRGL